jgi:hypothetical protein
MTQINKYINKIGNVRIMRQFCHVLQDGEWRHWHQSMGSLARCVCPRDFPIPPSGWAFPIQSFSGIETRAVFLYISRHCCLVLTKTGICSKILMKLRNIKCNQIRSAKLASISFMFSCERAWNSMEIVKQAFRERIRFQMGYFDKMWHRPTMYIRPKEMSAEKVLEVNVMVLCIQ